MGSEMCIRDSVEPGHPPGARADDGSVRELRAAHAALVAQLDGATGGPALTEARRFALKKDAARARAALIRMERAVQQHA